MTEADRSRAELAKPRIARGRGPMPTHVSYIFHDSDGRFRVDIHQRGSLRSQLGFHRTLLCADKAEFDAQMDILIAARVPFMVGHMMPGASDDAYFWLKEQGRPVDYLEIAYGGKSDWEVREIVDGAESWRGVRLKELLPAEIDLFDPANRPHILRPSLPGEPLPETVVQAPEEETASPATEAEERCALPEHPSPPAPESPPPAPHKPPQQAEEKEETPPPTLPGSAPPEAQPPAECAAELPKGGPRGQRWVSNGSALILVLLIGWSFWRATGYFTYTVPFEPASYLLAVFQVALLGGTTYAASWFTLFPRHFPGWPQRLELLALSLIAGVLIAFCELTIANIHFDDAARIAVPTTVIAKTIYKGKNGRYPPEYWTWHVRVESWNEQGEEQQLRISQEDWARLQPGSRIFFHPHPGRLGWLWYSTEELETPGFIEIVPPDGARSLH